jgi:hypothetical protein
VAAAGLNGSRWRCGGVCSVALRCLRHDSWKDLLTGVRAGGRRRGLLRRGFRCSVGCGWAVGRRRGFAAAGFPVLSWARVGGW